MSPRDLERARRLIDGTRAAFEAGGVEHLSGTRPDDPFDVDND